MGGTARVRTTPRSVRRVLRATTAPPFRADSAVPGTVVRGVGAAVRRPGDLGMRSGTGRARRADPAAAGGLLWHPDGGVLREVSPAGRRGRLLLGATKEGSWWQEALRKTARR